VAIRLTVVLLLLVLPGSTTTTGGGGGGGASTTTTSPPATTFVDCTGPGTSASDLAFVTGLDNGTSSTTSTGTATATTTTTGPTTGTATTTTGPTTSTATPSPTRRPDTSTLLLSAASRNGMANGVRLTILDANGLELQADPIVRSIGNGMEATYYLTIHAPCSADTANLYLVQLQANGPRAHSNVETIQVVVHGAQSYGLPVAWPSLAVGVVALVAVTLVARRRLE
jgi:hypothetical protein